MTAAIYMRVSTEEQRERQTIETQRQFATQYCELNKIHVFETYSDDGVTGTLPLAKRPAGSKMLEDARAGRFDTVLFYRLDRLGRDPRLTLNTVNELESCGVKVQSMTEPFSTGDATGRFLLTILSGVAGLERETFMERSRAGTDRLARDGAWLGGITPYGYRVEGKKREARLIVSDEPLPGVPMSEADVIRMIYHLSADKGWSCLAIAKHLTALGVPPSYSKDGRKVLRGKRKETRQESGGPAGSGTSSATRPTRAPTSTVGDPRSAARSSSARFHPSSTRRPGIGRRRHS
jgi:site-specific DNA recombinase